MDNNEKNKLQVIREMLKKVGVVIDYKDSPDHVIRETDAAIVREYSQNQDLPLSIRKNFARAYYKLSEKKIENCEKILMDAIEHIEPTANVDRMDENWILDFFSKAENISNEGFQRIWSETLTQEIKNPHTVSKRLLHSLYQMGQEECDSFLNFTSFCFYDADKADKYHPIIMMKDYEATYKRSGVSLDVLYMLKELSLIELDFSNGFCFYDKKRLLYQNHLIEVFGKHIDAGCAIFTPVGKRLFEIVEKRNSKKVMEFTAEMWDAKGCKTFIQSR